MVILALVANGLYEVLSTPAFQWDVVAANVLNKLVLQGLGMTLLLTLITTVTGAVAGILLAAARLSSNPVLRALSSAYVWFFRSVPLLVQLIFWFNIGYLFPRLSLSVPFGGPEIVGIDSRDLVGSFLVAVIALTLHEAAYAAEIVRGGVLSVDEGQREAGLSLGLSRSSIFLTVVLPQAMRSMLPPFGSLVIGILKATSLVSTIAVTDLMGAVSNIYNRTFEVIPLLVVATLWYLVVTSILSVFQHLIERRFGRGATRNEQAGI